MQIAVRHHLTNACTGVILRIILLAGIGSIGPTLSAQGPGPRIDVSFPSSVHPAPLTARLLVLFARDSGREPRLQIGWPGDAPPVFGIDVSELRPGATAVLDSRAPGSPLASLNDLPEGDYSVQASPTCTQSSTVPMATLSGRTWTSGKASRRKPRPAICTVSHRGCISIRDRASI